MLVFSGYSTLHREWYSNVVDLRTNTPASPVLQGSLLLQAVCLLQARPNKSAKLQQQLRSGRGPQVRLPGCITAPLRTAHLACSNNAGSCKLPRV
jgi:hypothetical protein